MKCWKCDGLGDNGHLRKVAPHLS